MDATYSEVFDVCTSTTAPSLIGLHTPVSMRPHAYLNGLFNSFRYFRYKGCKISVVPASSAQIDPAFISERPTGITNAVHPADVLNPILDLRADGTDLGAFIDDLLVYYGVNGGIDTLTLAYPLSPSEDTVMNERLEALYYQMLTSPGIDKHDINSAFQFNAAPTVYDVSTNIPQLPSRAFNSDFFSDSNTATSFGIGNNYNTANGYRVGSNSDMAIGTSNHATTSNPTGDIPISERPQFFTNGRDSLGWLPTITAFDGHGGDSFSQQIVNVKGATVSHRYTVLPKLLMHLLVLPKSEVRRQYLRIVVHHYYEFAEFHSSLGAFNVMMDAAKMNWNPLVVKYPSLPGVADAALANVGVPAYDMDDASNEKQYVTEETLRGESGVYEYQSVVTTTPLISYSDGVSGSPSGVSPGSIPVPDNAAESTPAPTE